MHPRMSTPAPSRQGRGDRSRRHFSALMGAAAALTVASLALSGCSSSGSPSSSAPGNLPSWKADPKHPVTITFANWADAETATRPGIEKMISAFESSHPGIKVKSQPISFTDIGHTLVLKVQSGDTPDVAELSGNDTFALAATNSLVNVNTFLKADKSQFIPSELASSTYKGKLIAVPWTVNPPGLWYDKKLMKGAGLDPNSPPKTMDQLMSDLATIHQKYPKILPMGLDTTNRDFSLSSNWSWMKTYGATPFHGGAASADTSQMKAYLSWMRQLATNGYLSSDKKIGDYRPLAAQNQVAFVWDQPVLQGVVQSTNKQTASQFYANWGVEAQPTGPSGKSFSTELGHQLVVFNKSNHQAAAYQFAMWLATSPQAVAQYTIPDESSLPPLAHPSAAIGKLIDTPVFNSFRTDVLPTVTTPEYGPNYSEASSPIMSGVQTALTSKTPIGSVASTMQSALKSAFQ
jgi:multiple sugar transport system substrate-binding protein